MVEQKKQMREDEIKLEGELRSISPPYQSIKGTKYHVGRLVDEGSREFVLFFWHDNRFDYDTKLKIEGLTIGEHITVRARRSINPKDGQEVYHVIQFGETSEEAEIF